MPYVLAAVFFTMLGTAYVKGFDLVKEKSPQHLPQFYLMATVARLLLSLTVIALFVIMAASKEEGIRIALTCIIMYVVMMVITLVLRH